jgi:hypothetical protein
LDAARVDAKDLSGAIQKQDRIMGQLEQVFCCVVVILGFWARLRARFESALGRITRDEQGLSRCRGVELHNNLTVE